ncbi:MAG: hypothetical protein KME59_00605 [Trichormus sp. ATA11-4-KO1]|nr:hypothetical protein [Trichormus sp. ATA11-4-KO1]
MLIQVSATIGGRISKEGSWTKTYCLKMWPSKWLTQPSAKLLGMKTAYA